MDQDYEAYMACSFKPEIIVEQISRLNSIADAAGALEAIKTIDAILEATYFNREIAIALIDFMANKYNELNDLTEITTARFFPANKQSATQNYSDNDLIVNKTDLELKAILAYIRNCIPAIELVRHFKDEVLTELIKTAIKSIRRSL